MGLRATGTLPLPVGIFVGHVWLLSVFFELVNGTRRRRKPGTKKARRFRRASDLVVCCFIVHGFLVV